MKYFILKDGFVVRHGHTSDSLDDLAQRLDVGESIHAGEPNANQWLENNQPPIPLAGYKLNKKGEMKRARAAEEFSTFSYNGNVYDCDPSATVRIAGASQLAFMAQLNNQAFSIDWTLADDSVITLNAAEMIAVAQALAAHVSAKHAKYRQKANAIDNAPHLTALNAITWND